MRSKLISFTKYMRICNQHLQDTSNWCYCDAHDEKKLCNHYNCRRWRDGIVREARDNKRNMQEMRRGRRGSFRKRVSHF